MSYVIYNKDTTILLRHNGKERHENVRGAKATLTRLANANKLPKGTSKEDFLIADAGVFYDAIEEKVERKNLISGERYMEGINTPAYMSPACETYWSM